MNMTGDKCTNKVIRYQSSTSFDISPTLSNTPHSTSPQHRLYPVAAAVVGQSYAAPVLPFILSVGGVFRLQGVPKDESGDQSLNPVIRLAEQQY